MKKFFGVLLLLIGLFLVALGMFGLGNTNGENKSIENQVQNEFTQHYKPNKEKDIAIGGAIATVGLFLNIIGIVLLVTKNNKQQMMEAELVVLKNDKTISVSATKDDIVSKIEKLGVLKNKGLLSEEEFAEQKKRILG